MIKQPHPSQKQTLNHFHWGFWAAGREEQDCKPALKLEQFSVGLGVNQCSALSAATENLGLVLFCHNTVVICSCWQMHGQSR